MLKNVIILLTCLFISGCMSLESRKEQELRMTAGMERVDQYNIVENRKISSNLGNRTFSQNTNTVLKATISALTNLNFTVENVDSELGFLMAQGRSPIKESRERELSQNYINRLTQEVGTQFHYIRGNYIVRVTLSIFETPDNRTNVMMSLTNQVDTVTDIKGQTLNPEIFEELHNEFWLAIDKALLEQNQI